MAQQIITSNISDIILAGNARFTIQNKLTEGRFTYKVKKSKSGEVYWVYVLRGRDNTNDYSFIGVYKNSQYFYSQRSGISQSAKSVQAFQWFAKNMNNLGPVQVFSEGRCMRCSRVLTVPDSVQNSIGPECIKYFR